MAPRKRRYDSGKKARRVARNVLGVTPPTRVIVPKPLRRPKHKKLLESEDRAG
ncbi:MAG: hypothetical protein HY235_30620 [Acidobacteria bacterium]|nr:hypothetical protein [Acidobacteriota bacterium]